MGGGLGSGPNPTSTSCRDRQVLFADCGHQHIKINCRISYQRTRSRLSAMGSQTFEVRCDHEALQFNLGSLIGRALNGGQQEARGVGATPHRRVRRPRNRCLELFIPWRVGAERRAGRSDRPARAGWAALRQFRFSDFRFWGERWSSGVRGRRRWELRGRSQQHRRIRRTDTGAVSALTILRRFPRAREAAPSGGLRCGVGFANTRSQQMG